MRLLSASKYGKGIVLFDKSSLDFFQQNERLKIWNDNFIVINKKALNHNKISYLCLSKHFDKKLEHGFLIPIYEVWYRSSHGSVRLLEVRKQETPLNQKDYI